MRLALYSLVLAIAMVALPAIMETHDNGPPEVACHMAIHNSPAPSMELGIDKPATANLDSTTPQAIRPQRFVPHDFGKVYLKRALAEAVFIVPNDEPNLRLWRMGERDPAVMSRGSRPLHASLG